ncbi:MAG: hypothetical protein LWX56_08890 [Ignavibacteria bacterium]|nr:hypothetical protein [Ignavibacteria bacterium]
MKYIFLTIFLLGCCTAITVAQDPERVKEPAAKELQFIGYSFHRYTLSNVTPMNDLLQGQVIGRLFGPNSTFTTPQACGYFEQRFVPMFVYNPSILDGYATFRALFKIDYTWGDQAYGVGNNRGGGMNGGQINLQTLMANVDIHPPDENWNVVVGLQRLFDNVRDPNVNTIQTAQTSGYKLSFFGTQATGVSVFGNLTPSTKGRFGYFQLWENEIRSNDDVTMWMADVESRVAPLLEVGGDVWYVYDRGKGGGGISVLGQGLNSALAGYNGATKIFLPNNLSKYEADLFWVGGHASYNRDFLAKRWWADAFVMFNLGTIDTGMSPKGTLANVFAVTANASLSYKYGATVNDKLTAEALFTSGDNDGVADGTLNSVITGNVYGSPVGIYSSHRAYLLFPDPQVINRYYSAVHDISNMGYGVTAGFFSAYKDLIPNKLNAKVGFAYAESNVAPTGGGKYIGSEVNTEIKYNLKVYLTLGVSAAYMWAGDFYDSNLTTENKPHPKNPWVFFTTLSWLMF